MFKKIFAIAALALALVGCNKEEAGVVPSGTKQLEITAFIGTPDTKLSYTANEDGSYKATFSEKDVVWVSFLDKDSKLVGSLYKASINASSIAFDGKSANFVMPNVDVETALKSGAVKLSAYLTVSDSKLVYAASAEGDPEISLSLAESANLTTALSNQVLVGSVALADLGTDQDKLIASIPFAYKTSLVTLKLHLPEGSEASGASTVTLSNKNNSIHNVISLVDGGLGEKSRTGDIVATSTINAATGDVTAYLTLWAADKLESSRLTLVAGDDKFLVDFDPKAALAAGKSYVIERDLAKVKTVKQWTPDEAGSMDFAEGGTKEVSEDFLTYANGKVSWTANTTGAPRSAKLLFENGSLVEVSQLSANDFKGDYTFSSKIFSANKFVTANNLGSLNVKFGNPIGGETLADVDGKKYTNQIGINGLYYDGVIMDATVDINYEAMTVRLGALLDARDNAQNVANGVPGFNYVAFLPEMGTTSATALWAAPWNFVQPDLSTTPENDYTWLWFTVSSDFTTITYNPNSAETLQYLETSGKTTANAIIGITIAVSSSAAVTPASVRSAYDVIYQGNSNLTFVRK